MVLKPNIRICCEIAEMCGKGTDCGATVRKSISRDFDPSDGPTLVWAVAPGPFSVRSKGAFGYIILYLSVAAPRYWKLEVFELP